MLTIDVKLAAKSKDPEHLLVGAPIINAPVMLAEWRLEPDTAAAWRSSGVSLTPAAGETDLVRIRATGPSSRTP